VAGQAFDPSAHLGETVTVCGAAWDGAGGALVHVDGEPLYIEGLDTWPEELVDAQVEVTGVLRARGSQVPPTSDDNPIPLHGLDGETFALVDASWQAAGGG